MRRINPSGVKEVTIRQFGPEQLEIIIPNVKDPDEVRADQEEHQPHRLPGVPHPRHEQGHTQKKYMAHAMAEKMPPRSGIPRTAQLEGWWVPVARAQESDVLNDSTIATRPRTD